MEPKFKMPGDPEHNCVLYWDSIWSLCDDLANKPKTQRRRNFSTKKSLGEDWDLGCEWDQALSLAASGWPEGGRKVEDMMAKIESLQPHCEVIGEAAGLEYRFDEEGDEIDTGAFLAGDERPWIDPKFNATKPIVRIGANMAASAGVRADTMMARGVMVAAVCRYLERAGYGTQIYLYLHESKVSLFQSATVMIKDSTEYLDPNKLAFWLAHPAAFRRIGFRMIEWCSFDMGYNYGIPSSWPSPDLDLQSAEAHLRRAMKEGWHKDPGKAAECALESIKDMIESRKLQGYA